MGRFTISKINPLCICKGFLLICLTCYLALFLEIQIEFSEQSQVGFLYGTPSETALARCVFFAFLTACFLFIVGKFGKRILKVLFDYRYPIALLVLAFCVFFELSGSSLGFWATSLEGSSDTLFGSVRPIRSDEWLVFTPFALAQSQVGFPLISDVIRGDETITSMVYAQPSWSIATIFRPFLWGYLLLGAAKGLSFFWTARIIALFLVTFECARLYTKDNKYLSALVATLVAFAPIVLWWFAINGIVELFVFGQLLVIGLYHFLRSDTLKSRFAWAFLMAWFAGCFVMILYPAWQVPGFYVFLGMGIWVVLDYRKNRGDFRELQVTRAQTVACFVGAIVLFTTLLGVSFWEGKDAISATVNTVYPGSRSETGGNGASLLFNYGLSLLLTVADFTTINQCEYAAFFSLFPLGSLLGLYALGRYRDSFSGIFVFLQIVFLVYVCVGFPEWLSKITLFSNVTEKRLMLMIGFVEILLIVRFLYLYKIQQIVGASGNRKRLIVLGILVLCSLTIGYLGSILDPNIAVLAKLFAFLALMVFVIVGVSLGIYLIEYKDHFLQETRFYSAERLMLLSLFCVVGIAGFFVNPVQNGLGAIADSSQSLAVQQIVNNDPEGKWISLNSPHSGQFLIANGAPTINSVNTYPDLDRWRQIDTQGTYSDVYNRYAHITVVLQESKPTQFELTAGDAFTLKLNSNDLSTLDVSYIYTDKELSDLEISSNDLTLLASGNGWLIYECKN